MTVDWDEFGKTLERLGFFRYLRESERKRIPGILKRIEKIHWVDFGTVYRDYPASEKSIGGNGGERLISNIRSVLRKNNVIIKDVTQETIDDTYCVYINQVRYVMCSGEELRQPLIYVRRTIAIRLFKLLNKLLKEAGSEERIYSEGPVCHNG